MWCPFLLLVLLMVAPPAALRLVHRRAATVEVILLVVAVAVGQDLDLHAAPVAAEVLALVGLGRLVRLHDRLAAARLRHAFLHLIRSALHGLLLSSLSSVQRPPGLAPLPDLSATEVP